MSAPPTQPGLPNQDEKFFREPNLGRTSAARQHYVPRFYLERFTEGSGRLEVQDLLEDRHFLTATHNAAVGVGFNDISLETGKLSTEDWLSGVEKEGAAVIRYLVHAPKELAELDPAADNAMARYIAAQIFRVPAFREYERLTRKHLVGDMRSIAKGTIDKQLPAAEAQGLWEFWQSQPDEWWLQQEEPIQDANMATYMLQEVQGWANLLLAMNWRVGRVEGPVYTSDNPVSAYAPAIKPWWATGSAIWEKGYVLPLAAHVLMWIYPMGYGENIQPRGSRVSLDFSRWEASLSMHVVTNAATRFLYGSGPYVTQTCAFRCLTRLWTQKVVDAIQMQGYDPRPPRSQALEEMVKEATSSATPAPTASPTPR